jgi:hypothetical protein
VYAPFFITQPPQVLYSGSRLFNPDTLRPNWQLEKARLESENRARHLVLDAPRRLQVPAYESLAQLRIMEEMMINEAIRQSMLDQENQFTEPASLLDNGPASESNDPFTEPAPFMGPNSE